MIQRIGDGSIELIARRHDTSSHKMIPYTAPPLTARIPDFVLEQIAQIIDQARGTVNLEWSFDFRDFARMHLPVLYKEAILLSRLVSEKKAVIARCDCMIDLELEVQKFVCLAMCSVIGRPTATDKSNSRIVWEVKAKNRAGQQVESTISENHLYGKLHTDSSYRSHGLDPEKYVALLCVRPAKDGGGVTQLVEAGEFLRDFVRGALGPAAIEFLRQTLVPFAAPIVFSANTQSSLHDVVQAKIIGNLNRLRYRHDSIVCGIAQQSPLAADAMLYWLEVFDRHLSEYPTSDCILNEGDLLLLDNHEVLHGRTAFTDYNRLLLRVRMDEVEYAKEESAEV